MEIESLGQRRPHRRVLNDGGGYFDGFVCAVAHHYVRTHVPCAPRHPGIGPGTRTKHDELGLVSFSQSGSDLVAGGAACRGLGSERAPTNNGGIVASRSGDSAEGTAPAQKAAALTDDIRAMVAATSSGIIDRSDLTQDGTECGKAQSAPQLGEPRARRPAVLLKPPQPPVSEHLPAEPGVLHTCDILFGVFLEFLRYRCPKRMLGSDHAAI